MEFPCTNGAWDGLKKAWNNDPFPIDQGDVLVAKGAKELGNGVVRGMLLVTAIVTAVVTPILIILDLIYSAFCCRVSEKVGTRDVVEFYRGEANVDGVTFNDVMSWKGTVNMEGKHHFIQWLFPLRKQGGSNPTAPVIDQRVKHAFGNDPVLFQRMMQALDLMLDHYGLKREGHDIVRDPARWAQRQVVWLNANNHNYLRLTRMITSMQELGCGNSAQALGRCLKDIYRNEGRGKISPGTYGYWMNAAGLPQ